MVTFNDEQAIKLVARKSLLSGLFVAACITALCCGVVAASLTAKIEQFAGLVIALLAVCGVALACFVTAFILLNITENNLSECVAKTLAKAMGDNKDILEGDKIIALTATYSGDNVTLSRQNSFKEVVFDLSKIAKTRAYSYFGTRLTEYLEAFYFLRSGDGFESVTITDGMGKSEEVLQIVYNGVPTADASNNYFIKRGLIK